jgi:hypothetical protein
MIGMKTMMRFLMSGMLAMVIQSQAAYAQKIDEERMKRDIEVAENVLSTLIKQQINTQRNFFGVDIKGNYQPGYGVTFRLPGDFTMPIAFSIGATGSDGVVWRSDNGTGSYVYSTNENDEEDEDCEDCKEKKNAYKLKERSKEKRQVAIDSTKDEYNKKIIQAAKDFIIDYGDFVSQLGPNERIVVTNQGEGRGYYGQFFNAPKRVHISVEGSKADITAFKQGKLNRDQLISKIKVVNTESVNVKEQDMELMSSIFSRLYRPDLSKTYFSEDNIYYERLKDYGAVFYMQVYSSNQGDYKKFNMPTLAMENVDQQTRDKKVVELYPKFEQELKDNILEYGRTLKSLKDEEVLVFNVTLTKCKDCGIPSTLELTVKSGVLKDFGMGKIDKSSALSKMTVKKGANQ